MPKKKTKKSAVKRFKKTGGGKITYSKVGTGDLLGGKSRKRKRKLRHKGVLSDSGVKRVGELLVA
jgi:large subunit ribosomal protein L35